MRVSASLLKHTAGASKLELPAGTVGECIAELERRFPGVAGELRDESGQLLPSVNLYVNGEDVRYLSGLGTALGNQDELSVVIAIAGGGRV